VARGSRAARNDPWPELGPRRRGHRYRRRGPIEQLIGVVLTLSLAFAAGLSIWWLTADQPDRNRLQQRLDTWPVLGSLVHTSSNPIANLPDDEGGGGGGGGRAPSGDDDSGIVYPLK
jgi:hypothetical protein